MNMSGKFLVQDRSIEDKIVPWKTMVVDISLQYWPNDNLFTDENGQIIYDIFSMVTPNDLIMFKDRPYTRMYFLHVGQKQKVVGISYKDPCYYEEGDYKRYPTIKAQIELREKEISRYFDVRAPLLKNHEFRRKIYPELYS